MGGALQAIARSSPARGARMEGRERVGDGRQGRAEGKVREEGWGVTTPYSLDGLVSLATQDGRKETGGREQSVRRSGNRSRSFPG